MNLHDIVSGIITQVNPFIDAQVGLSTGYTTNNDGTRQPSWTWQAASIQVQAATEDAIKFANNQAIQGVLREVYLNGNWTGLANHAPKGEDRMIFDNKSWKIIQVLEHWPDWTHILVVETPIVAIEVFP